MENSRRNRIHRGKVIKVKQIKRRDGKNDLRVNDKHRSQAKQINMCIFVDPKAEKSSKWNRIIKENYNSRKSSRIKKSNELTSLKQKKTQNDQHWDILQFK